LIAISDQSFKSVHGVMVCTVWGRRLPGRLRPCKPLYKCMIRELSCRPTVRSLGESFCLYWLLQYIVSFTTTQSTRWSGPGSEDRQIVFARSGIVVEP